MSTTEKRSKGEGRESKYIVARASDVPPGERLIVDVNGRSIGVLNVDGVFYAFLNRCPHRGAALCRGDIVGLLESSRPGEFTFDNSKKFLRCPWHGWEFDLVSGDSWFDPIRMRARPFGVQVEHGDAAAAEVNEGVAAIPEGGEAQFVDLETHRIKGPYTADVIPVTVEDDYIVISMRRQARPQREPATVGEEAQ